MPERSTLRNEGKPPVFAHIRFDGNPQSHLTVGVRVRETVQRGPHNCGVAAVEIDRVPEVVAVGKDR